MPEESPLPVRRQPSYPAYPEIEPVPASPRPFADPDSDEIHIMDYWRVLVSRRWTIFAVLFTCVAVTLIWTLKQTPVYRATALIQIDRENPNILSFRGVYEIESATDDTLRTQFEVLRSRNLARRVVEDLKLDRLPEFQTQAPSLLSSYRKTVLEFFAVAPAPAKEEPDQLRRVIDQYLDRLTVSPRRQARVVDVSFESENPAVAAQVINAHADHYIKQNLLFKWEASQQATEFLENQLVNLKANLEKAQDALVDYSRRNEILFTGEGQNTAEEKLRQLQEALTEARNDRFRKESYHDQIAAGGADSLPQLMTNALISSLTAQLADLRRERSALSVQLGPLSEDLQKVSRRIEAAEDDLDKEKQRVIDTIEAEYVIAGRNEEFLSKDVARQTEVVNQINAQLTQYDIMKREAQTTEQMYQGLLNRSKEAAVSAGLNASNIRIVDPAEVPVVPVRPRKATNLLLGVMAGLIFGVGLAFFRDYLNDTFQSGEDVTRFLGVPVLGIVPKLGSVAGSYGYGSRKKLGGVYASGVPSKSGIDLTTFEAPSSVLAEAYRSVRTSLLLSSADKAPRAILVTSSSPSEGKTATAINTAISLTQTGARVVLVDADMRRPRIHTALSLDTRTGLSSFLSGGEALRDIIHTCNVPNLFVVPCGVLPPNPAELILSGRFRRLLDVLREYFDYVIIDSPPLNNVSDARILALACDCVVMVVKASSTSRHQVSQALGHLTPQHVRMAGVVLNDLDVRARSYYGSRYKYTGTYAGKAG